MKITTALNHRDRAVSAMRDLYHSAPQFCPTSKELNDSARKIKARLAKCPYWVVAYVEGFESALRSEAIRPHVFFYTLPDGRMVSTDRSRDDYYEKQGFGPREVYEQAILSGHYWIHPISGDPKPFFTSRDH